jgi:drug/metabolite transporter (DMT)-like permease
MGNYTGKWMEQLTNMMQSKWVYIGLILVAAVWGTNFGLSRLAMESFDPILFSFLRFGLAIPFFFVLLWIKEGSIGVTWRAGLQLMLMGAVGITALEIALMYAIKYTTLANASLLNVAPWPIFAALFAPLFIRETLTMRLMIGGAAAMIGVILVILGGGGIDWSSAHMTGNLLALGTSLTGALFNLASMPLMRTYSALRISAWTITFGSLFMFPMTLGSWRKVDWGALTGTHYAVIIYNVIACTFIAFIVWNTCMYRVGAARANFYRYAVPVAAAFAGFLMYDEKITMLQLAGAAFMAGGLLWISWERRSPLEVPHAD